MINQFASKIFFRFYIVLAIIIVNGCKKFERITGISDSGVREINIHSARYFVKIGDVSGSSSIEYGFCWATHSEPNMNDSVVITGQNPTVGASYDYVAGHLSQNTVYYMRAFTIDHSQVIYSNETRFQTEEGTPPVVVTSDIEQVTSRTVLCGGTISNNDEDSIIESGICYNQAGMPTTGDSIWPNSENQNPFSLTISGLTPAQHYYIRAFARNSAGIGYGQVREFTTEVSIPDVSTLNVDYITANTALLKGLLIYNGGAQVTDSGFFWSLNADPGIYSTKIPTLPNGRLECFTTDLPANNTVYCRAYATNTKGTGLGSILSFKTMPATSDVSDYDGNTYTTAQFGNEIWMTRNLKTTHYANGNAIPVADVYNDDASLIPYVGRLYSFESATNNEEGTDIQGACPDGWHLPAITEWNELVTYFGGSENAGLHLKDINNGLWENLPADANLPSGFNIPAGGYWYGFTETYGNLGLAAYYWTSEKLSKDPNLAFYFGTSRTYNSQVTQEVLPINSKISVRCVKNE